MYERCQLFTLHTIDTRIYKLKTITKNLIHLFLLWRENKKKGERMFSLKVAGEGIEPPAFGL